MICVLAMLGIAAPGSAFAADWPLGDGTIAQVRQVKAKLIAELKQLRDARQELCEQTGGLVDQIRRQERLLARCQEEAETLRVKYQQAQANGETLISYRESTYRPDQLVSQVSLLLVQMEGIEATIDDLQQLKQTAEGKLEEVTVRIASLASRLPMLDTWGAIAAIESLPSDSEQLIAQLDGILTEMAQASRGIQVRSVCYLTPDNQVVPRPAEQAAIEFLVYRAKKKTKQQAQVQAAGTVKAGRQTGTLQFDGTFQAVVVPEPQKTSAGAIFRQF
jgi:DNA repair exonuclease SbcCD ATPase subunit